jgi:hypothetical protein
MFEIKNRGSSVSREVLGGATTFMAMSYILFVQPPLLAKAGMDAAQHEKDQAEHKKVLKKVLQELKASKAAAKRLTKLMPRTRSPSRPAACKGVTLGVRWRMNEGPTK